MTVLHALRPVLLVDDNKALFLCGLLVAQFAQLESGVGDQVARLLVVQLGRPLRQGFFRCEKRRILFVLHHHQPRCPGRGDLILRNHGGDIVAVHADPCV